VITVSADHPPSAGFDENEVIEEEPNGVIDFSQAVPQKDGSLCITKTKYIEKMEKQPVKECWSVEDIKSKFQNKNDDLIFCKHFIKK
jgi:hypothetical protein